MSMSNNWLMKKRIISIIVAIAAIGAAAVTSAVIKRNSNTILNQNVEALMDGEISVGDLCAYQPEEFCRYQDAFGIVYINNGVKVK